MQQQSISARIRVTLSRVRWPESRRSRYCDDAKCPKAPASGRSHRHIDTHKTLRDQECADLTAQLQARYPDADVRVTARAGDDDAVLVVNLPGDAYGIVATAVSQIVASNPYSSPLPSGEAPTLCGRCDRFYIRKTSPGVGQFCSACRPRIWITRAAQAATPPRLEVA